MANQVLEGIRVLDLSRVLAGPFCAMLLGDNGADVIKVEPPQGDETRRYGPPFMDGYSTYYLGVNRNKRGIVLDLATPEGQEVVRRLVLSSDVLIENFKTGAMERWGLGYETLRELNPRLVYCSISGYGRTGPYRDVAGYDGALQAHAGMMSINGEAGGEPTKVGIAIGDLTTGLFASQGILLALLHRQQSGQGQRVDVSLLESLVALLHPHNTTYLNTGVVGRPHGNSHPMISPYDLVQTADRPIYLPTGNDGQFRRMSEVLGLPALPDDPRFANNQTRIIHRQELLDILNAEFRTRRAADWCKLLWAASVPAGPVNNLAEVFADPQVQHRQMALSVAHPLLGQVGLPGFAVKLEDTPAQLRRHPPLYGEHSLEVLAELGYEPERIAQLVARKITVPATAAEDRDDKGAIIDPP